MSTREKQWLQIFERQQWIINQAKQQAFLFDQDLASKLIIAGIALPPWLLSSDPDVLNHHELISGVPLPRTRPVITGSHFSVLDKPVDTAHYKQLTYGLCMEHCGVNKGFDVGGKVLDLPLCPISDYGCASDGVPQDHREEDPGVTSPEDERDAKVSDVYHDSALPPARGAGEGVSISPQCHISIAGCASNGVLQDQKEENPGGTSPQDQRDARILDIYHDPALSLARVQRSKSRQRALAIRNSTQKSCSQDKDNANGYAGGTIKCVISTPQSEVEKPKIGEFQSKEKCTDIYSGRITRSRSSGHQENSLNVSGLPCIGRTSGGIAVDSIGTLTELSNHVIQPLELVNYSQITNDSCLEGESKSGDYLSKQKRTVKKDSMCANLEREEHSPKALEELRGRSISQEDAGKSIVSMSPVEETHLNEDHHMVERSASSPEAQKKEGGMGLEGVDSNPIAPFTFLHEEIEASVFSSLIKQAAGHPQDSLMEETGVAHPTSINIDGGSQCIKENPLSPLLQDNLRLENAKDFSCAGRNMQAKRFDFGGTSKFSELSGCAPHMKSLDLIGADDAMPVLERFVIKTDDKPQSIAEEGISFDELNLPNTAVERASILVQLCKSACMQTPVAYSYKLHKVSNLHRSVPTGLLEHVDLRSTLPINDSLKQLEDGYDYWSEEVGRAFCGRSYSDCLPNASEQSGWDIKKPYSSPVGKLWDRIASSSSSSGKRVSSIPELPCIDEENENTDDVTDTFQDGIVSEVLDCSSKRPPLADITEIPKPPASVSKAVPYTDRFSLDSVTTEFSLTGNQKSVKKKLGIQNSSKRRYNNKENQSVSRGTKDIKRATGSLQNRSSKPKFPGKTSLRKGGPSLSELEPKRNNIVSNITSFIPLVQQKQAAAALPGKRDIKVKALETAEAAKRLAERKDNERKMKKEGMKVERARVEQENLRKLELQKKTKEEERKKNEADIAAKKRQREEEDRKEKQRKRMRVEEGRREQREHEDKLRAEKVKKEIKCLAIDGTRCESKESKGNTVHKKMDEEWEPDTLRSISETDPRSSCVSANDGRRGSAAHEEYYKSFSNFEHKEEVQSNLDKATENEKLVANTCREQSYDISPYKESDDENEEDDDSIPNNKFIPSWASKNCLALVASRQNRTDPEVFFPPESFCCISEVLLPRKCQQQ